MIYLSNGLENRLGLKPHVGSNPSASASFNKKHLIFSGIHYKLGVFWFWKIFRNES